MSGKMLRTYNDIYLDVRKILKAQGISAFGLEARLLVSAASEKSKEHFVRDMRLYVNTEFEARVGALLERRLQGEPLPYIIGSWEFFGLPMTVTRDLLIPRIDTETVAEQAISAAAGLPRGGRVLDLCCGTGCIGIAVAAHVPEVKVVMADLMDEAIRVSRSNSILNYVSSRATCVRADATKPPERHLGMFDVLVCNPPYIPTEDIKNLDISVRDYEPVWALDGGEDGLSFFRSVTLIWKKALRPGGQIIFECGVQQAKSVEYILRANGFDGIATAKDTLGIERGISATVNKGKEWMGSWQTKRKIPSSRQSRQPTRKRLWRRPSLR